MLIGKFLTSKFVLSKHHKNLGGHNYHHLNEVNQQDNCQGVEKQDTVVVLVANVRHLAVYLFPSLLLPLEVKLKDALVLPVKNCLQNVEANCRY